MPASAFISRDAENLPDRGALDDQLLMLMSQSESLVQSMQSFFRDLDRSLYRELLVISDYIAKARNEIGALRPNDLSRERIPGAGAELDAVVRDTEAATMRIMAEAEALLAFDGATPEAWRAEVEARVMSVFEACGFQDITGQRVSKVVAVLRQVEERVGRLADALGVVDDQLVEGVEDVRRREQLIHGPSLNGPETEQTAIDDLFAGGDEPTVDQDGVDRMFD